LMRCEAASVLRGKEFHGSGEGCHRDASGLVSREAQVVEAS